VCRLILLAVRLIFVLSVCLSVLFYGVDCFAVAPTLILLFLHGYRLVDEGKVSAEEVCVFEMTERVGGRLFSLRGLGPDSDLSVDAGGYRTVRLIGFSSSLSTKLSGLCCFCVYVLR
jgi:hypothetical protein